MPRLARPAALAVATTATFSAVLAVGATVAGASGVDHAPASHPPAGGYVAKQILSGKSLHHHFVPAGSTGSRTEPLASPDDLTMLGRDLFTGFQNGVGPQGQPSTDGNTASTVVEFTPVGKPVHQWDITGKCDGLTADPARGVLIATVNEDANSSLYTISPSAPSGHQVQHFTYNRALPHNGGTDAISVDGDDILISASAPGTTGAAAPQPTYPAVYRVGLDQATHVAAIHPVFYDEARAVVANRGSGGHVVHLALTDPDSNSVVPGNAPRFAGDFMLTSQGDEEQVFMDHTPGATPGLSVLRLSQSVNDTAWATLPMGALYATDDSADAVDMVTGAFGVGTAYAAVTPCDANDAPPVCPSPPTFPPNYLGTVDPWTGTVTPLTVQGAAVQPNGLLFVPAVPPAGR